MSSSRLGLALVLSLLAVSNADALPVLQDSVPSDRPSRDGDSLRIARIAAAGRLWGRIRFFHPYLATRAIDWDRALVEAMPGIGAARTRQDYAAAIGRMLASLGDGATRVVGDAGAIAELPIDRPLRIDDGVIVISFAAIAHAEATGALPFRFLADSVGALMGSARGVVLDIRGGGWDPTTMPEYYFAEELSNVVPRLVDAALQTTTWRYRMHNGFAPQSGTSSGGYYSGLVTLTPSLITPHSEGRTIPIAFVVDRATPVGFEIASGLRAAGRAIIVGEVDGSESIGALSHMITLADSVVVSMRTAELIGPDGSVGFMIDTTVRRTTDDAALATARRLVARTPKVAVTTPVATLIRADVDSAYASMSFPSVEYRLLALFRFWNVIEYFYPYRDLADEPWSVMLERYIPLFESNTSAAEYERTVRELVAEIDDSHGFVRNAAGPSTRRPRSWPPLAFRDVRGEWMVSHVLDSSVGVNVGDVVLRVDRVPVDTLLASTARIVAASTPQALRRSLRHEIGRGDPDSVVTLELRSLDGRTRIVPLVRSVPGADPRWMTTEPTVRTTPVFGVLPSGFGYADLERLEVNQIDSLFTSVRATHGTILDMRGYPRRTGWQLATYLPRRDSINAIFSRPFVEAITLSVRDIGMQPSYTFTQPLSPTIDSPYTGRVVILINEFAQSQSEHLCLALESAHDVTFIGTPTAGANGDLTNVLLPGGLIASFSGHNVRHADGRRLQRLGIQPDVRVEPTVRGLAEGRDEALEAAIEFLRTGRRR